MAADKCQFAPCADAQLMELGSNGGDGDPASRSSFTARTQAVATRLQGVFAGAGAPSVAKRSRLSAVSPRS